MKCLRNSGWQANQGFPGWVLRNNKCAKQWNYFLIHFSKSKEIFDVISIKGCKTLNDSAKTVLCIDIACELLNIQFDTLTAIKFSSIKKSAYQNARSVLMKLMNLGKKHGIVEILLKMGISNPKVETSAKNIYAAYEKQAPNSDLDHPQYCTMAVYQACKLEKVKVTKKSFIQSSNLKPNQFTQLENSWEKWVGSVVKADSKDNGKQAQNGNVDEKTPSNKRAPETEPETEDYDVWAKRILSNARCQLKALKSTD